MNRRFLFGVLSLALGCGAVGCGSSGNGSTSSGGASGTASGGNSGTSSGGHTGSGGTTQTGSGGMTQTGSGGTPQTGSGGKGAGGMTQTGSGGKAMTGSGGSATTGSGGMGATASGGTGTTGSGGSSGGSTGGGGPGTGGTASGGMVGTADQNVLERNKNPSRDGMFVQPTLTKAAVAMMTADTAFNTAATFTSTVTNGANVAASPLYLDAPSGGGLFFIPTVGGDVVARKEDGTSAWSTSIGAPATGGIGCTSFAATTPPLGILSTPVIDAQSKTIYVAGIVGSSSGVTGQIASAIDITTGKVKSGWPVNVHTLASFDPTLHNQRSALSLVNGLLYIAYAGYVGDCGSYHGRVVAIDTTDPTKAGQWMTGDMGGGIWASGGLAADGNNLFVSTGNYVPLQSAPATHTDSEEVVRLTGMGTKADYFYPADWAAFDKADGDVGSSNPVVVNVPGATPSKLVVAIAKGGSGYLLDASQLRGSTNSSGMGGQLATFNLASASNGMSIYGAPAAYTTAMGTYVVMSSASAMGCPGGGGTGRQLMAVKITPSPLAAAVAWCAPMGSATNAIATTTDGKSDAVVWFANSGKLVGVDGDTGANLYTSSNSCASVPKWSSPIAVKGRIVVAGNGRLCAWGLPGATAQSK